MAVHVGLSQMTKTPELILEEGEAKMLADPLAKIAEDFDFVPDPRVMNALALIGACGMVYGPRIVNIRERRKEEAKAKRPPAPVHVLRTVPREPPAPPVDPNAGKPEALGPAPIPPELDAANAFRFEPPEAMN